MDPLSVVAVLLLVGVVGSKLRGVRPPSSNAEDPWAAARAHLHAKQIAVQPGTKPARSLRVAIGSAQLDVWESVDGTSTRRRDCVQVCVRGLPATTGVRLQVRVVNARLHLEATPRRVGGLFVDAETHAQILAAGQNFLLHESTLTFTSELRAGRPTVILEAVRLACALTERWLALTAKLELLVLRLGFARLAPFDFTSGHVVAESFRHGRRWTLSVVTTEETCEVVVQLDGAAEPTLRFPYDAVEGADVVAAIQAREDQLRAHPIYR